MNKKLEEIRELYQLMQESKKSTKYLKAALDKTIEDYVYLYVFNLGIKGLDIDVKSSDWHWKYTRIDKVYNKGYGIHLAINYGLDKRQLEDLLNGIIVPF